jgi:hypothetical protein
MSEEEKRKIHEEQEIIGRFVIFANLAQSVIEKLNMLTEYGYPDGETDFKRQFSCREAAELFLFERDIGSNLEDWKELIIN